MIHFHRHMDDAIFGEQEFEEREHVMQKELEKRMEIERQIQAELDAKRKAVCTLFNIIETIYVRCNKTFVLRRKNGNDRSKQNRNNGRKKDKQLPKLSDNDSWKRRNGENCRKRKL